MIVYAVSLVLLGAFWIGLIKVHRGSKYRSDDWPDRVSDAWIAEFGAGKARSK